MSDAILHEGEVGWGCKQDLNYGMVETPFEYSYFNIDYVLQETIQNSGYNRLLNFLRKNAIYCKMTSDMRRFPMKINLGELKRLSCSNCRRDK